VRRFTSTLAFTKVLDAVTKPVAAQLLVHQP
jgi:hypothetical protein